MLRLSLWVGAIGALLTVSCAHRGPAAPTRGAVEFTPVPELEAAQVANPHDHGGKPLCQRCHVNGEKRPSIDPMTLCAQCHNPAQMRHPMGIEKAGGAGALPLHDGMEIACHTCHDPHDLKKHPHGLRAEYAALCLNCHPRH